MKKKKKKKKRHDLSSDHVDLKLCPKNDPLYIAHLYYDGRTMHAVAADYPQWYSCHSSLIGTASYETYVPSQRKLDV